MTPPSVPNEKLTETLFTHHALRVLAGCGATVYTPSTREEYTAGYDSRLTGLAEFDEVLLQFKTPYCLCYGLGYSIPTTTHQHYRLKSYPVGTAFYITHRFDTRLQLEQAQIQGEQDPNSFLRHYVAIDVFQLDSEASRIRFDPTAHASSKVAYKLRSANSMNPTHTIGPEGWLLGDKLIERFKDGRLGARIILEDRGDGSEIEESRLAASRPIVHQMSQARAKTMAGAETGSSWGTAFRLNEIETEV